MTYYLNCKDPELAEIYYKLLCEELNRKPETHNKVEYPYLICTGTYLTFSRNFPSCDNHWEKIIDTYQEFKEICKKCSDTV